MKRQIVAAGAAFVLGLGSGVASAQSANPPARPAAQGAAKTGAGEVTLIGCVEFESDYRQRMAAGRGGVLGSGVGASDEFMLTNVRPASAGVGTTGTGAARSGGRAAAAGPGAGGGVYTLTGPQEKNLKRDVGRQVTVVGTIENAGKRSTGADVTDISDLPRIAISTWHPVGDFCPAK